MIPKLRRWLAEIIERLWTAFADEAERGLRGDTDQPRKEAVVPIKIQGSIPW